MVVQTCLSTELQVRPPPMGVLVCGSGLGCICFPQGCVFGLGLGREQFTVSGQERCPKRSPGVECPPREASSMTGLLPGMGGGPSGHVAGPSPWLLARLVGKGPVELAVKEWVSYLPGKVARVWGEGVQVGLGWGDHFHFQLGPACENKSGRMWDESAAVQGLSFSSTRAGGTASRRPHP